MVGVWLIVLASSSTLYRKMPLNKQADAGSRLFSKTFSVRRVVVLLNCSSAEREGLSTYICVCVCVFFPSILDIKFVGRTSRGHTGGRSHRIFNPPSFCGACLDFCREKDSAIPFPRRP